MGTPGALAHVDDQTILDRIRAGEHSSAVAQSLGVHKAAISHRYKGNAAYLEAREAGAEVRLDEIEAEIARLSQPLPKPDLPEDLTDENLFRYKAALKDWQMDHAEREFNLACAREKRASITWRNEREFPHRWAPKGLNINVVGGSVTIGQALAGDAQDLLQKLNAAPQLTQDSISDDPEEGSQVIES